MNKTLLALLVGVGIGILVAPGKGSDTIRRLRNRLDDYRDLAEDEAEELLAKGKKAFNKGKAAVNEAL